MTVGHYEEISKLQRKKVVSHELNWSIQLRCIFFSFIVWLIIPLLSIIPSCQKQSTFSLASLQFWQILWHNSNKWGGELFEHTFIYLLVFQCMHMIFQKIIGRLNVQTIVAFIF